MSNRDLYTVPEMPETTSSGGTEDTVDQAKDQVQSAASTAQEKGQEVADQAKQKASQAADQAQQKADQGMDKAASGLDQAAEKLRQQGEQRGGTAGSVASTTAKKLDSASQYLRDKDSAQVLDDIEALVRRKPVESLLVAAGVGFVLSKILR
jgi:ElaB/YqjD/DUF883 family membrane-anchored ribosome-binding protein